MRRCRAVIFDLDDTLVQTSRIDRASILIAALTVITDARRAEAAAVRFAALLKAEPFPPSPGEMVASWRTSLWARALGGELSELAVGDAEAVQQAHDTWVAERLGRFKLSAEVRAMVRRLQSAGYTTGVLTNGSTEVQRAKVDACGACELFGAERVIVAGEHPEQKPAPSIFRTACAALGQSVESAVMVGDSLSADVAGGINAGMLATVWVKGALGDSLMKEPATAGAVERPQPTYTVGTVLELEAVLDLIN
uniref:Uncharacterized protein n=1 Tax=Coccolithus braarudii TaxID=221442 RepID=A0A7S0Q5K4_9EUKA|mmetsp:Transcript_39454/g.84087  ORF Transcript_39454/g.84087 Transcript_39454/m.84087 type:complete len:252 (+) Transcript_39454:42-797(+)